MTNRLRLMDVGWVLVTNLFLLAGVLAWGWPAGNVFVLFWIENVILGAATAVKIATADGVDPASASTTPRWARTLFFVFHYGIFALVHGVFSVIIAFGIGFSFSLWALGLPAALIALRYGVELATGWFLGDARRTVTPGQAFASPYPRLIVLHVATILGFFVVMSSTFRTTAGGRSAGPLGPLLNWLDAHGHPVSSGLLVVSILLVIKTIADLLVLRSRAKGTPLKFSYGTS